MLVKPLASLFSAGLLAFSMNSSAVVLDNGKNVNEVGYWSVDLNTGGETRKGYVTARGKSGNIIQNDDIIFDYYTYIKTKNHSFRLQGSNPVLNQNKATSQGSFAGSNGNQINWSVNSAIKPGSNTLTSVYEFTANTGSIGELSLFQYLDEDVKRSPRNDLFFYRGTTANNDLLLYTIDGEEQYGVAHGGAYDQANGLVNASFSGWAVDTYNRMKSDLLNGTEEIALDGLINDAVANLASQDANLGTVYGQADIVSVMGWEALASANKVVIVTTLGGLPDINQLPPVNIPAPGTLGLIGLCLAGFMLRRNRK